MGGMDHEIEGQDISWMWGMNTALHQVKPIGAKRRVRARASARRPIGVVALVVAMAMAGCLRDDDQPTAGNRRDRSAAPRSVLLDHVVDTLNNLDEAVSLQLRAPEVVLDASSSRDGRDVVATLTARTTAGEFAVQRLDVASGNSAFLDAGVRRGDWVRYHVDDRTLAAQITVLQSAEIRRNLQRGQQVDPEVFEQRVRMELQNLGDAESNEFELPIVRVVDDQTLEVAPLPLDITSPQRMEVWRYGSERVESIVRQMNRYVARGRPAHAWQPTPDGVALGQAMERLNQWLQKSGRSEDWTPDGLRKTLEPAFQEQVDLRQLQRNSFTLEDGFLLREALWLRDIARWARGDSLYDVDRASALFDWCVRNIQLHPREDDGLFHRPWETLLYGRGTVEERAWVFVALCRQQGMDAVLLAMPDDNVPGEYRLWAAAVASDDQLHLFDPWLGMPVPGVDGAAIATLADVVADPQILRQLDLGPEATYPVEEADLSDLVAFIVASPFNLSERAAIFQARLTGDSRIVLSVEPSRIAERIDRTEGIGSCRLWPYPYLTRARQETRSRAQRIAARRQFERFAFKPMLWKGRVLHFRGRFDGEHAAKTFYRMARPPDTQIRRLANRSAGLAEIEKRAKNDASFWLGMVAYDDADYALARDYLKQRVLEAFPDGPWTAGATYNLARTYEEMGQIRDAIALYDDDCSAQQHGNRLRARALKQELPEDVES